MSLKHTLFALALAGGLSLTTMSQAAPKPVFGYLAKDSSFALTINGQRSIQLKQIPPALRPAIEQDLATLSRGLNRVSQGAGLKPQDLQPVLVNGQHQIRHRDQLLLALNPAWANFRQKNRLATLLDLTNQLRRGLGASPLRNYAFLSSSRAHQTGLASWYGGFFHGRLTANGERYNIKEYTAAHKKLPFGTRVLVTNLVTQQSVVVKINDRGPFVHQRIIDLSPAAFNAIGSTSSGVMKVKLTVLS
ncbi:MAG: hypothetical protein CVV27_01660 [Candidatus Melainabacteria bacterium HGW-Melainabacteria-1]|nr:MAG: hypothetical protein CVV27_01660 [Candidatus Melainabacteria bacterium HGW-Melainabacteria-1]